MKLIVGLGNPGNIYIYSRHNIGFLVIKALSKSYKLTLKPDKQTLSKNAKFRVGNQEILLAMPLTFMNLSGSVVSALLKKYKVGLDNLLVICDDLDLGLGRLKVRRAGSSGGHRGLKSIIDSIDSQEFARLRIGIGRPFSNSNAAGYVLSHFTRKEKEQVKQVIERAVQCCQSWLTQGIEKTMNIFNTRSRGNE